MDIRKQAITAAVMLALAAPAAVNMDFFPTVGYRD